MIIYRQIGFDELDKYGRLLAAFCIETNADDDALANILTGIESGKTRVFAAENGVICGVVGYRVAGEAAVSDFLYVIPEKRKSVIGGKLYHTAEKHAKTNGLNKSVLIVTEDKEPLYAKIGFKRKFILLEKEI